MNYPATGTTDTTDIIWCGLKICVRRLNGVVNRVDFPYGELRGSDKYFYTHDHLGSIRELTDSTGQVRAQFTYTPYGSPFKLAGDLDSFFRYTGQYSHVFSGLIIAPYRAYEPSLGRWLNRDPIGERGGVNLYGYVGDNPVNWVDPLGLDAEMCYRPIQGYIIPGQHCFIRFNGDNNDTLSFDPKGVHSDPTPEEAMCKATEGDQDDDCVKREMEKCKDYKFITNNCCHCAEQALKACGQSIPVKDWPNWPINPGPQSGEPGYKPSWDKP